MATAIDTAAANVDVLGAASTRGLNGKASRAKMEAASKDFEAVFMAQMLKPMWAGVETDPMFGGGAGEDVMKDLLIQEYGKSMAAADGYALASSVMDAMIRMQDVGAKQV